MTDEITIGTRLVAPNPAIHKQSLDEFEVIGETRVSWIVGQVRLRDGTVSPHLTYKVSKDTMRERGAQFVPRQFFTHRGWKIRGYRNALERELMYVVNAGGGLRYRSVEQIEAACEALMIDTKTLREKHVGPDGTT